MKAKLIFINWMLSFFSLCIDTERSSFIAVVIVIVWFTISSLLFIRAQRRGDFREIEKRFKIDEL